jgi:hypothetical protein
MAIAKRTILISGSAQTMAEVAALLPQQYGTLTHLDDQRYMLSHPSFAGRDRAELMADIRVLLERITGLLHAYQPGGLRRIEIDQVLETTENGPNSAIKSTSINVMERPEFALMETDSHGLNRFERLLKLADGDQDVGIALRLLLDDQCDWPTVYDVGEFLLTHAKVVGRNGWITKTTFDLIKHNANYFRHPGNANNDEPEKKVTLTDGRSKFFGELRRWLEQRLSASTQSLPSTQPIV